MIFYIPAILGVPEFIKSPRHIEGTTGNLVEFSWIIGSNEDYIKPFVLVNGTTNLSNITLDYDLKCVTHYPRTEFVDVTLVLDPASTSTDLKPGIHEIQLCIPFTADVVGASDYNQNPKCSDKTKFTLTTAGMCVQLQPDDIIQSKCLPLHLCVFCRWTSTDDYSICLCDNIHTNSRQHCNCCVCVCCHQTSSPKFY